MRDGCVDFERLLRDALPAIGRQELQSAHVVQPVSQLDDDDANIVHHGEQHLADAFGLAFLARVEVEFAELGDAVDAARHFLSEVLADLIQADARVFHRIVEQAGFEAHQIHLHVGQDQGDIQRVNHIRLARYASLTLVRLRRHPEAFSSWVKSSLGRSTRTFCSSSE